MPRANIEARRLSYKAGLLLAAADPSLPGEASDHVGHLLASDIPMPSGTQIVNLIDTALGGTDWRAGGGTPPMPVVPTTLYADVHTTRFAAASAAAFGAGKTSSTTARITPPDVVAPGQYISFFFPNERGTLASATLAGFESIAALEDMGEVTTEGEAGHHWQSTSPFFTTLTGFAWTLTA